MCRKKEVPDSNDKLVQGMRRKSEVPYSNDTDLVTDCLISLPKFAPQNNSSNKNSDNTDFVVHHM